MVVGRLLAKTIIKFMNEKAKTKTALILILFFALSQHASAASVTVESKSANVGSYTEIGILVDTEGAPLSGMQATINYDPAILQFNSAIEGNLFQGIGAGTFFNSGIVVAGQVKNTYDLILGNYNTTGKGTYLSLNFTALQKGTATITLSDIVLAGNDAVPISVTINNGQVVVTKKYDINGDGVIDSSDISLIGQHFGEAGQSQYDINSDGFVNVLDMIVVSKHIGE